MMCPLPVAEIVTAILYTGLLRIRAMGGAGDASRCALEADHLHNLPNLLTNFTPELLQFYWEVERPDYLRRCPGGGVAFEELWAKLSAWTATSAQQTASR